MLKLILIYYSFSPFLYSLVVYEADNWSALPQFSRERAPRVLLKFDVFSINVEDNIMDYCMGDIKTEVVLKGETSKDANQNEEHDIPDVDLDMDYDM